MRTVLIAALAAAAGCAAGGETVRTLAETWALQPGQRISVDVPIGEVTVLGHDSDEITLEVRVRCSRWHRRCPQAADGVEIQSRSLAHTLRLEVEGLPQWSLGAVTVEADLRVPRSAPILVDLGVGEVEVDGLGSDVTVDVGIGSVELTLEAAGIGAIDADTGIGESTVRGAGEAVEGQRSLLGDQLHWLRGEGEARVHVDVGIGEIDIDLL